MRRLLVALALTGFVSGASAGDFELPDSTPILRGSSPYVATPPTYLRWAGFYAGGQVGYGSAHVDFSSATRDLYAFMLRELALESEVHPSTWQVLGLADTGGASGGGFVGYNTQWDDIVVGFDIHYSRTSFLASAPATPIGRRTSAGGNVYDVVLNGAASMQIHDWGAGRIRAGYVIDNMLPYATFGFAFGRADITRSATVVGEENPPPPAVPPTPCAAPTTCVPFSYSASEVKKNAWIFGWTAGGGVDFLIMPNVFVRGEYEYVSFAGVSHIKAAISTARLGAALKF